uniref:Uncharacterized protein n=1 Tax=viral metagenome TaxID=1070528 RepID=A0A6C0F6B8_9ZZZZ
MPDKPTIKIKTKNGLCYEQDGWLYISIKGSPKERGYAHGKCVAEEMKKVLEMLEFMCYEDYGRPWEFFVEAGRTLLKQTIIDEFPEFYEEMEGIAEGCNAGGTKITVDEVLAWNNYMTLTEYWYPNMDNGEGQWGKKTAAGGEGGSPLPKTRAHVKGKTGANDRCSAFIANGAYTEDGKIVVAHNNFSNFIDGQYAKTVVDVKPDKGHRILYQAFVGWIWSGTDFFVTSKGIIGTETTMGGFLPYENNFPISCRIRQAMQYGNSLDDYVSILLRGNSGDYANSWLFGNINSNEIMRLELGLKYHNVERTKNGYFIGFNAPYDPRIRNLECTNSGFDDIRRHQGARKVRLADLMDEHKGKINIEVAKAIISDHYDVYLNETNPCSRTVCSHYELDPREYMSQADRPKPYQPRGALDGCVVDSEMAKKMSFMLRYGNSCGIPFDKNAFCDQNRIWDSQRPYLHDRPQQPWSTFTITSNFRKLTRGQSVKVKPESPEKKSNKKTTRKMKNAV